MSLRSGDRLGPYEIVGRIGAGGMGEVWKARDVRLGREVAIKVLPEAFASDAERLRRFEQEARSVSALNHPNILTVHDLGTHEGAPFLVLELLEGETLQERLQAGPLPVKRAVELALQLAKGLAVAHAKGLVHRDLKPANLFITRGEHLKILDFGLAKQMPIAEAVGSQLPTQGIENLTSEGLMFGTVGYMSPEQVVGKPADARSDIFAFGVVLYEMLSGRRAFERGSTFETLSATLKEDPPELMAPGSTIPPTLQHLVAHCLEKEPARRFQNLQDAVYDLEAVLAGSPVSVNRPPNLLPTPGRRLRAWALALIALVAVVTGGGLILLKPWARAKQPTHSPSVVALPTTVLGAPDSAFLTDAIPDTLSTLLAGVTGLDIRVPPSSASVEKVQGDVARVAEAFRAEFLVLTTVTAEGELLRLNVKLAEGATQRVRWARQYEGTRGTYTSMLQEAAQGLARAMKPSGTGGIGKPAFSSEVELALREGKYFQGRYAKDKDVHTFDKALEAFRRAQALEPASALLFAEIAFLFSQQYFLTGELKAQEEAERWVERSLTLDPRCGRAWWVRSWMEGDRMRPDLTVVVDHILKAARYAPQEAATYVALACVAPTSSFAVAAGHHAVELDPLDAGNYFVSAFPVLTLRRPEEVMPDIEKSIQLETIPGTNSWLKFLSLFYAGRFEEAKQVIPESKARGETRLAHFIMAGDIPGGRAFARAKLAALPEEKLRASDWGNLGLFNGPLLVRLGLNEEALWLLDRCTAANSPLPLDLLLEDPSMKTLRGDPRFSRALAASRQYAQLWLERSEAARARGEFPPPLEPALAELKELVQRSPL